MRTRIYTFFEDLKEKKNNNNSEKKKFLYEILISKKARNEIT